MKTLATVGDLTGVRGRIHSLAATDGALWGSMSVGQMVCHLSDSFEIAMGEREAAPMKAPMPRALLKRLALRVPMQWPKGVETVPEINQGKGRGTAPAEFEADLARLLGNLERFAAAARLSPTHAIFGGMTTKDWMRWGTCTATIICGSLDGNAALLRPTAMCAVSNAATDADLDRSIRAGPKHREAEPHASLGRLGVNGSFLWFSRISVGRSRRG